MNAHRPQGARRWYPGGRTLAPIRAACADVPPAELHDLVLGAAELIRRGRAQRRFWTPWSLFGERSSVQWLADVADMRAEDAEREHRLEHVEAEAPDTSAQPATLYGARLWRDLEAAGVVEKRTTTDRMK